MTHAYDKNYLEKARVSLARMLDFAVYDMKYDITDFFDLFIKSGYAEKFENGDIRTLVGMSGIELAYMVVEADEPDEPEHLGIVAEDYIYNVSVPARIKPQFTFNRSREYWAGWALAYYQWATSLKFSHIVRYIPIADIRDMYTPYHEMDIRQFVDHMNDLLETNKAESNLKIRRQRVGYSQKELAEFSLVPLRTIQQYEQRQKNINKAATGTVISLARVLYCEPEDLLEIER
jgi:DNA-binding transcriptional regulator YiaG